MHPQFEAEGLLAMSLSTAECSWQGLAWEDNARIAEKNLVAVQSAPALRKLRQTADASRQEWMDLQRGR